MDFHLQLCTVALVSTVAWPVCAACGADPRWLAWHFHFIVWAWVLLGGFAAAVAVSDMLERKLAEWALLPAVESPLAWFMLVVLVMGTIGTAWVMMAPVRAEYRSLITHGAAGLDP